MEQASVEVAVGTGEVNILEDDEWVDAIQEKIDDER